MKARTLRLCALAAIPFGAVAIYLGVSSPSVLSVADAALEGVALMLASSVLATIAMAAPGEKVKGP